jgi:hypothetical protein
MKTPRKDPENCESIDLSGYLHALHNSFSKPSRTMTFPGTSFYTGSQIDGPGKS